MSVTLKIVEGDVQISSASGRPIGVATAKKLQQDIKEFFTVDVLPSGFGAGLESMIGVVSVDQGTFLSLGYSALQNGLLRFMQLQRQSTVTPRPDDEMIASFNTLRFEQDVADPTKYYFSVNIITQRGTQVPVYQLIQLR
jgi:hypothetical protein